MPPMFACLSGDPRANVSGIASGGSSRWYAIPLGQGAGGLETITADQCAGCISLLLHLSQYAREHWIHPRIVARGHWIHPSIVDEDTGYTQVLLTRTLDTP